MRSTTTRLGSAAADTPTNSDATISQTAVFLLESSIRAQAGNVAPSRWSVYGGCDGNLRSGTAWVRRLLPTIVEGDAQVLHGLGDVGYVVVGDVDDEDIARSRVERRSTTLGRVSGSAPAPIHCNSESRHHSSRLEPHSGHTQRAGTPLYPQPIHCPLRRRRQACNRAHERRSDAATPKLARVCKPRTAVLHRIFTRDDWPTAAAHAVPKGTAPSD